jgi:SagB-type dehydrogenase family enzyme
MARWKRWFSRKGTDEKKKIINTVETPATEAQNHIASPLSGLKSAAVFINSFTSLNPSIASTGFRTSQRRYEATTNPTEACDIADTFLLNTRLRRDDRENEQSVASYFEDVVATLLSMSGQRDWGGLATLPLPSPTKMPLGLSEVVARRRSVRSYTGDVIHLEDLSAILAAAGGISDYPKVQTHGGEEVTLKFRTVASAGGLFPIDIVFAALAIEGLPKGVYRFDPNSQQLVRLFEAEQVDALLQCFAIPKGSISIELACGVFFLIGQPWRTMRKYGNRGMRFVLMEAGAIAHAINLAIAALGYGSVECASVYDDEAHSVLRIDGVYVTLIHSIVFGCPA